MRVIMLGVSHQTASVDVRERLALSGEGLSDALSQLGNAFDETERVIISTCNRTEIYVARPAHHPPSGEDLRQWLAELCDVSVDELTPVTILRENDHALGHLYRVASGLESMVLGEPQILGQIK